LWGLSVLLLLGVAGWLAMQFVPDAILQHPNVSVSAYAGLTPGLAAFLFILAREGITVALGEGILETRTKWGLTDQPISELPIN
jgi:hypothetical protein